MQYVLAVVLILLFLHLIKRLPGNDAPAPILLKNMEVYKVLKRSVHINSTVSEAIEAFSKMCEMEVNCKSDLILVESHSFSQTDNFNIHIARQFEFSDRHEFVQLHLDLDFSLSQLENAPNGCKWYDNDSVDIQKVLNHCPPILAVKDIKPSDVRVFIDWTWS